MVCAEQRLYSFSWKLLLTPKDGGPGSAYMRRAVSGTRCPPTITPKPTWMPTSRRQASPPTRNPLFRSAWGKTGQLTSRPMHRNDAWRMIKRRAQAVGLPDTIGNHTFRATGITAFRKNGGSVEHAQQIANHASPQTTRLYDRSSDEITLDEVERILI